MKKIIYSATAVNVFLLLSFYNAYSGYSLFGTFPGWLQVIWIIIAPASFFILLNAVLVMRFTNKKNYKMLGRGVKLLLYLNLFLFFIFSLLLFFTLPSQDL